MPIERVAIIFDDTLRPDTTGIYCLRALRRLAQTKHFLPTQLSPALNDRFDLHLYIDDGLDYEIPSNRRPSALWAIDTHLCPERLIRRARDVDFVFAAQRDGVILLREHGIRCIGWLPLACDPELHLKHDCVKDLDTCFVGHLSTQARRDLASLIQARFQRSFVGQRFFEEMAMTYSRSHTVLNLSIRNDINMRVFEALACGSLLITNDLSDNGMVQLFRANEHLVTYRTIDELSPLIDYYLEHDTDRERIAAAGREVALTQHTYLHRMQVVLHEVERRWTKAATTERITPPKPSTHAKTSIIILTRNEYAYTQQCLDSIRACTTVPYEIIVIDNGSTDETCTRLSECADVTLIENHDNLGFAAGVNQGIIASTGTQIVLLNNDTIVTSGWLERMLEALYSSANVGLVGPCSNNVPGPQRVDVDYSTIGDLEEFAKRFSTARSGQRADAPVLVGFCLLIRRQVIDQIGKLDEAFGVGTYEDYDYCQRAVDAGYRLVIAQDTFVHHFGSVTMSGCGVDLLGLLKKNEQLFRDRRRRQLRQNGVEPANRPPPFTSIVIIAFNELAYTRLCLESVRSCTQVPHEIIVVDNGSSDGTQAYLRAQPDVRLIENACNRGFPAAVNQGIKESRGECILLLNNDVIVTPGWLGRLHDALHSGDDVGLVGPVSNLVSGAQQIVVDYNDHADACLFAGKCAAVYGRQVEETNRLVGFCLLIRREVIQRTGFLDERFGIGNFEDDDFCRRTRLMGYRAIIARGCFVHHFGSRTFLGSGVNYADVMAQNAEIYSQKWCPKATSAISEPTPCEEFGRWSIQLGETTELSIEAPPRVSLCMIIRDSARTLRTCLESVRPWVEELIVVDTGSSDESAQIAAEHGAKVYQFAWCDDFAAARNESLKHARGEWIFWMDSDDTIDAENGRKLCALARQKVDPGILGFVMQVHCPGSDLDGGPSMTAVDHVKMFRNHPSLRFEGRIHEQILPSIRRVGGDVAWTDIFVCHSGSDQSAHGRERKQKRDLRLLELELQERPRHPFTLFNLGMTYADANRHGDAIDALEKSRSSSQPGESHVPKVFALLAGSYAAINRNEDAIEVCMGGLKLFPNDPELLFRLGILRQMTGDALTAKDCYQAILRATGERQFRSIDRGIVGFKARHNLALLEMDLGRFSDAAALWRAALQEAPRFRPAWEGLIDALLAAGRYEDARDSCGEMTEHPQLRCVALILRSKVVAARGLTGTASTLLREAEQVDPNDRELLTIKAQRLFEDGHMEETERTLLNLLALNGRDGAAYHNLGCVYARLGRGADAECCFRQSLSVRPDSEITRQMLEQIASPSRK